MVVVTTVVAAVDNDEGDDDVVVALIHSLVLLFLLLSFNLFLFQCFFCAGSFWCSGWRAFVSLGILIGHRGFIRRTGCEKFSQAESDERFASGR